LNLKKHKVLSLEKGFIESMKKNDYISSLVNTMDKSWNSQLLILASRRQGFTRFRFPSVGTSSITSTWSTFIHPGLQNVCPISHRVIPFFLPLNIFFLSAPGGFVY